MPSFTLNGQPTTLDVPDDMPLLWAIRDVAGLTGTKFGCGISMCGACTVHMDGAAIRSCVTPVSVAEGKAITTIEVMDQDPVGKKVQAAWRQIDVVQCGYCQSGQIMTAAGLLKDAKGPLTRDAVLEGMAGNLCRCGTYNQIAAAVISVHKASA